MLRAVPSRPGLYARVAGVDQQHPQQRAALGRQMIRRAEQRRRRRIPGQDPRHRPEQVRRRRVQPLDQRHEQRATVVWILIRRSRGALGQRQLGARQGEQRRPFGGIQAQRPRQGIEHLRRGMDVAPLLEPRVPGHPDPGERGQLLTPQARRAAAGALIGQADVRRRHSRAPRAQKGAKLITPDR